MGKRDSEAFPQQTASGPARWANLLKEQQSAEAEEIESDMSN